MTAMRSKSYTALQKTYDQCYLTCSTAIFYESQGNEPEALRCWRECMSQIQYHNATYRTGSSWRGPRGAKSDTEKTLEHALKSLELQCQERMDILETLRISRLEGSVEAATLERRNSGGRGVVTQTVPLPMPSPTAFGGKDLPPPLPARPQPITRQTGPPPPLQTSSAGSSRPTSSLSPAIPPAHIVYPKLGKQTPEKNISFIQTLRTKKTSKKGVPSSPEGGPATKAATLAWGGPSIERSLSWTPDGDAQPDGHFSVNKAATDSSVSLAEKPIQRAYTSNPSIHPSPHTFDGTRPKPRPLSTLVPPHKAAPGPTGAKLEKISSRRPQSSLGNTYLKPPITESTSRRRSLDIQRKPVPQTHHSDTLVPPIPPKHVLRQSHASKSAPEISRNLSSLGASDAPSNENVDPVTEDPTVDTKASIVADSETSQELESRHETAEERAWNERIVNALKQIHKGVDENAVKQILNEIVVKGDEVQWDDVAGLESAKLALKEAVVYPFLRPDLFMGLREPARGMLLFGPPGTGKTMIARAVATESKSTFFSISASSLTSKYLGESEKLVRALFALAKALAPSIIFVDEIDSLLSSRSTGEHEATRRIKTEFLIQWSDLQKAAAGKDTSVGDASRVLVLAATNLPWAIDEAARRRFVRRQYIPLPEADTRRKQFEKLLSHQKHELGGEEISKLVEVTNGFSGSDITALAKDAAMGPLRSLGEALLKMKMEHIRPMVFADFEKSLASIKPSVGPESLARFEEWARQYGERV